MNLNHLRVFEAIAAAQSITKGAQDLRISQPAASKQLSELEAATGTVLVDRLPRGIRLTEVGEVLFRHARDIFAAERRAEADLRDLRGLRAGHLAIGASTTIGSYLLPGLFARFRTRFPGVTLALEIANTAAVQAAVLEDDVDFGLTEGLVGSEQLQSEVFARDEMVLIVGAGRGPKVAEEITLRELLTLPLILREHGSGTRDIIEASLRSKGLHAQSVLDLGSTEAVKNAVAEGLGVALVSSLTVELELRVGRLRQIRIVDHSIQRSLQVVTRRGKRQSAAASAFTEMLQRDAGTGAE